MKLLQINTVINTGSTGRIAEDIGLAAMDEGWESCIAYGRYGNKSQSKAIKIGTKWDNYWQVALTRFLDKHGLSSKKATRKFIEKIKNYKPDIIHLHNIHGYYLNYKILFEFLKGYNAPVIWTLHDCWPFTGHCSYFDITGSEKWQTQCGKCPCKHTYPKSWFIDNSFQNFTTKKEAFTAHPNLTLVTPSYWLKDLINQSFLKEYKTEVIYNGTDLNKFRLLDKMPLNIEINKDKSVVLGVASVWEKRKGLADFIKLSEILTEEYQIVLIGLSNDQKKHLPNNITGITRTNNFQELVEWYNYATVFVNPTYEDNFPTTNIEALACGTPVITYNTGGSPEAVSEETGIVVPKNDIKQLKEKINTIRAMGKAYYTKSCRTRAERYFDREERFKEYLKLYERVC